MARRLVAATFETRTKPHNNKNSFAQELANRGRLVVYANAPVDDRTSTMRRKVELTNRYSLNDLDGIRRQPIIKP